MLFRNNTRDLMRNSRRSLNEEISANDVPVGFLTELAESRIEELNKHLKQIKSNWFCHDVEIKENPSFVNFYLIYDGENKGSNIEVTMAWQGRRMHHIKLTRFDKFDYTYHGKNDLKDYIDNAFDDLYGINLEFMGDLCASIRSDIIDYLYELENKKSRRS